MRELVAKFRLGSTNAANDHLVALVRKGLLERTAKTARSLVLTSRAEKLLAYEREAA